MNKRLSVYSQLFGINLYAGTINGHKLMIIQFYQDQGSVLICHMFTGSKYLLEIIMFFEAHGGWRGGERS